MGLKLNIVRKYYNEIVNHAKDAYPHEGCGTMVGKLNDDGNKVVIKTLRMENINKKRANDRYDIDPAEFLSIEKEASLSGLDVLGFYHTHPDHPEYPSGFDRKRAWPVYSYLIISVICAKKTALKSWVLEDEQGDFVEEEIEIL